MNSSHRVTA
ncbi:hypothetical protein CP02DC21_1088, partial [Chlamydia psittaci 02DC21]